MGPTLHPQTKREKKTTQQQATRLESLKVCAYSNTHRTVRKPIQASHTAPGPGHERLEKLQRKKKTGGSQPRRTKNGRSYGIVVPETSQVTPARAAQPTNVHSSVRKRSRAVKIANANVVFRVNLT